MTTADPAPWRRRARAGLLVAALGVLVALTSLLPWEWSFIDDGLLLTRLQQNQATYGWLHGLAHTVGQAYRIDLSWGLFRPAYWLFTGTFYLLPVGVAHAARLAMLLCALAGVLVPVWQRFTGRRLPMLVFAGAGLLACEQMYVGIWYPSLQELSGLALVGLGLLATRRPWLRTLLWLVAAWFKAPFCWLLIAYGLLLCRRRETRRTGVVTAALGLGTLVAAVAFSHGGSYTSALTFSVGTVRHNLSVALGLLAPVLVVLLLGFFALRPRLELGEDPLALVLLLGAAGYLANLLIWQTGAYYLGPVQYLLIAGAMLAVREIRPYPKFGLVAALAVLLLAGGYFGASWVHDGEKRMRTVAGLRDCVLNLPDGSIIGYNRAEAWDRLNYIAHGRRPSWTGEIAVVKPDQTNGFSDTKGTVRLDYMIYEPGYNPVEPTLISGPTVCRTPDATVYKVVG